MSEAAIGNAYDAAGAFMMNPQDRMNYVNRQMAIMDYNSGMNENERKLHKITAEQDPTTFSFRLYLSNGVTDDLNLTNMFNYRVKDPEQYYCQWNMDEQKLERFVPDPDAEYLTEAFELLDELKTNSTITAEEYTK